MSFKIQKYLDMIDVIKNINIREINKIIQEINTTLKDTLKNSQYYIGKINVIKFEPPIWVHHDNDNCKYYWNKGIFELKKILNEICIEYKDKSIFIIHGHDNEMKLNVKNFIKTIGLIPIILHEQTNRGRTIIEKFEEESGEGTFAIVLLSPDDFGRDKNDNTCRPRARQNVIFEFGFFFGKIGRKRVTSLYKKENNFELPSDISGILYIKYDESNDWRKKIYKELDSCGYKMNPL